MVNVILKKQDGISPRIKIFGKTSFSLPADIYKSKNFLGLFRFMNKMRKSPFQDFFEIFARYMKIKNGTMEIVSSFFKEKYISSKPFHHPFNNRIFCVSTSYIRSKTQIFPMCFSFIDAYAALCVYKSRHILIVSFRWLDCIFQKIHFFWEIFVCRILSSLNFYQFYKLISFARFKFLKVHASQALIFFLYKKWQNIFKKSVIRNVFPVKEKLCLVFDNLLMFINRTTKVFFYKIKTFYLFSTYRNLTKVICTFYWRYFSSSFSFGDVQNETSVSIYVSSKIRKRFIFLHRYIVQSFKLKSNRLLEATSKIEQNTYSAVVGYRPPWVVSSVAQNCQLYAKFALARAITNQNWLSGLNCTQRL